MQPDIRAKLQTYQDLLVKWQKTVNLVSNSTLADAWKRHFEDSLQILDCIPEGTKVLADIGSGAGFPGLVIAIARPEIEVHLIESDARKCAFLSTVSRETGASNVRVHTGRIESVLPEIQAQVVTARALAALPDLLGLTESQWGRESPASLVFPKGVDWQKEVDLASVDHSFDLAVKPSKTASSAAIMCISGVKRLTVPQSSR